MAGREDMPGKEEMCEKRERGGGASRRRNFRRQVVLGEVGAKEKYNLLSNPNIYNLANLH